MTTPRAHSIRRPPGAKLTPVGPGLVITSPLEITFRDTKDYDVTATVEPQGGRLVATGLYISQRKGGPSVSIEGIRQLSVAAMIREVANRELTEVTSNPVDQAALTRERIATLVAEGPTERTLRLVAYLYRRAVAVGDPPTQQVEKTMGLSRSKAGRWISLARERNHLGPAEGPGKASV